MSEHVTMTADELRQLIADLGCTQGELAACLPLHRGRPRSRSSIAHWLAGRNPIPADDARVLRAIGAVVMRAVDAERRRLAAVRLALLNDHDALQARVAELEAGPLAMDVLAQRNKVALELAAYESVLLSVQSRIEAEHGPLVEGDEHPLVALAQWADEDWSVGARAQFDGLPIVDLDELMSDEPDPLDTIARLAAERVAEWTERAVPCAEMLNAYRILAMHGKRRQ